MTEFMNNMHGMSSAWAYILSIAGLIVWGIFIKINNRKK